jgi:uncharacterized protein (TIGR02597 family)
MSLKSHLLVVAAACIGGPSLSAQTTVTTDPVGSITTPCLARSDTYIGIPFTRPPEFNGTVQSADDSTLTVTGSPGWMNNQFVYAAGSAPKHYYVLVGSGGSSNPKEGHFYPVVANGSNTLTVDTTFDSLTGIVANTQITLIPYWTPATIFPASAANISFTPTTSSSAYQTQLRIPNSSSAGIKLPPSAIYYFSKNVDGTSNNVGWRQVGDINTADHGDDPLLPDSYFVVRNDHGAPTLPLTAAGSVLMKKLAVPLLTSRTQQQDNAIAMIRPLAVPLVRTGLTPIDESFTENDQLLLFDNSQSGFNKKPRATYVFSNGWRLSTDRTTDRGNDLIPAASALLVRKGVTTGDTVFLNNLPTYVGTAPITPLQVASRKVHGAAGAFNVNLPTIFNPGLECRIAGANNSYTLVYSFDRAISAADGASLTQGTADSPSVTLGPNPNQVTVSLTGVPAGGQHFIVALNGIHDTAANVLSAISTRFDVLPGDINADRHVNVGDINQAKSLAGQPVNLNTFRADVNLDGHINVGDTNFVKSKAGTGF